MNEIELFANIASVTAIICNLIPKLHILYKIYTTQPLLVNQLSTSTLLINIYTNICFLFYMVVYKLYTLIIHCSLFIFIDISLIHMKSKLGVMKKSSSQTNLTEMQDIEANDQ